MLVNKVNALSQKLIAKMGTYKAKIIEPRKQTKEFEVHYGATATDLYHSALKLKTNVDDVEIWDLYSEVMNAVNQMFVTKKWTND
ncbi:MAG: hypothetical protein QW525_04425 [Thermoplasmatales archaeon]